jgi:hypothetical protein|eukprot:SAG25_NODE_737_length_5642_cov_2.285225_4_plen_40_part_00
MLDSLELYGCTDVHAGSALVQTQDSELSSCMYYSCTAVG